jgi:DNA primase
MKIQPETIANIKLTVDPESVLNHLGFNIVKRGSKELRGPCKIHGGDNITGFRFNLETRTWCCYTRHCEGDGDRDLVGLVQKATGSNFVESVRFLADIAGVDLNNQEELSEQYLEMKQKREIQQEIKKSQPAPSVTSHFPELVLEDLKSQRSSYFEDRGFPVELLDFYEIGGFTDGKGIHRETIPIRDEDGALLTISGRRTDSNEDPKYLLMKNINKGTTLYNLDVAKWYTGSVEEGADRTLILVEGFVDVWGLAMQGVYNAVAAMGTDITPNQRDLLSKYAENVIIMLDADKAGRAGAERVNKMLERIVNTTVVDLPDGKDPKDFTYIDVVTYLGG